jgi:hypothetical protein
LLFRHTLHNGCPHFTIVTGGGPNSFTREEFEWVNTMIGYDKRAINGTYHAINPRHLSRYLAKLCYRFNSRVDLPSMKLLLLFDAAQAPMSDMLLKLAQAYG